MNAITARSILINAEKCPAKSPFLTQGLESRMISFFFFFVGFGLTVFVSLVTS